MSSRFDDHITIIFLLPEKPDELSRLRRPHLTCLTGFSISLIWFGSFDSFDVDNELLCLMCIASKQADYVVFCIGADLIVSLWRETSATSVRLSHTDRNM